MTDPVLEIIRHELGKLQTLHAFKMSGIVHPPRNPAERRKNGNLRSYHHTLKTIIDGYKWLEDEYDDKKRRKEIQEWATVLYKDGRRNLLRSHYTTDNNGEAYAYIAASEAIISAFKQL